MQDQHKSRWNPNKVRRAVRLTELAVDGVIVFTSKSFTSTAAEDKYHPMVDIQSGAVSCDCPHFTYRLAKMNPLATDTAGHCKHLQRAVENLHRRGLLVAGGER